jgi:hypothetical protein
MRPPMNNQQSVVLIYKRTHTGDPNADGVFGVHDCMGSVRNRKYDAVIGIGGKQPWRGDKDIACKINWIGIFPARHNRKGKYRGLLVTFAKFCLYNENGPLVQEIAPKLYKYMYQDVNRRVVMSSSLPSDVYEDVVKILSLAENCPPSKEFSATNKEVDKCR